LIKERKVYYSVNVPALSKVQQRKKSGYYLNNVRLILFLKAQDLQKLLLFSSSDMCSCSTGSFQTS